MTMNTLALVRSLSHGGTPDAPPVTLLSDGAVVSPSGQEALAGAYLNLPLIDRWAVARWVQLAQEVEQQAVLLARHGFTFSTSSTDPYPTHHDMFNDVFYDRHIAVLDTATTGPHPVWTNGENNLFRAVHDVFGHFAAQRGFDRHGEEAAFRRHALMFSDFARPAMTTETRGQNAALIMTGEFQPERIALLPAEWQDPYALVPTGPEEYRAIHAQQRELIGA